jgi:hypothetical protein
MGARAGAQTGHQAGRLVWRPSKLKAQTVDSYLVKGEFEQNGTPVDAALEHLHKCSYKLQPALQQLRHDKRKAQPASLASLDSMTAADIDLFEKLIAQVGKNFHVKMDYAIPVPPFKFSLVSKTLHVPFAGASYRLPQHQEYQCVTRTLRALRGCRLRPSLCFISPGGRAQKRSLNERPTGIHE